MKKLFSLMLLLASIVFTFSSCSDDDDITVSKESLIGTWNITWAELDGESIDLPTGSAYLTFKADESYRITGFLDYDYAGKYKVEGNTVVCTTQDPIIEYLKFTKFDGNNAEIEYSNNRDSIHFKFKATKK